MSSLHVLAVEPYYGGSHRAFLEGVVRYSRHRWTVIGGPAKHWKWRMRVSPLSMADAAHSKLDQHDLPDLIFCSGMLDVAGWLAMVQRLDPLYRSWSEIPIITYFHENQWTYPQSPRARVDFHYGYTNLLSAIVSQRCIFNSAHHRDSFLAASESFIERMPDSRSQHDFAALREKSTVVFPGFDPPFPLPPSGRSRVDPINIGWVSRWEYDKRPDRFQELLNLLHDNGVDFRLSLLGPRSDDSGELKQIRAQFGPKIVVDQFHSDRLAYWNSLREIDLVVSTADHEFFGIAICEAIWAGAAPVVPDRLSYPELVPPAGLYHSLENACQLIASLLDHSSRSQLASAASDSIRRFQMCETVPVLDDTIEQLYRS